MLQNAILLKSQDLLNIWNASVYIHICYLLKKQTAVQSAAIQTAVPNQFEHDKSLCRTKMFVIFLQFITSANNVEAVLPYKSFFVEYNISFTIL